MANHDWSTIDPQLPGLLAEFGIKGAARKLNIPYSTLHSHCEPLGLIDVAQDPGQAPGSFALEAEIPVIRRDYSDQKEHLVYPLGDLHLGGKQHNVTLWAEWLEYLRGRKTASLLGTGDFLNAAIEGEKSDIYEEMMTVGDAKRLLRKQLAPLAGEGRIDGLAPGNHEERVWRKTGDCPILDVCDSLGVPYVPASALFVYTVGDYEYEIYLRHGTGRGQSLASLAKSQTVIRADCYVTGHVHRQAATTDDIFERNRITDVVERRKMYFVSSGSFLGYEKYAAVRGYSPGRMGSPRILLDGTRFDMHVSI